MGYIGEIFCMKKHIHWGSLLFFGEHEHIHRILPFNKHLKTDNKGVANTWCHSKFQPERELYSSNHYTQEN